MSRSIRITRVWGFAALAVAGMLASGCSSGQAAETALEHSAVDGGAGNVGSIALRNVRIAFPDAGKYPAGGDAALEFAAVNTGGKADTLVSIKTDAASAVTLSPARTITASTETATASATGTTSAGPGNAPATLPPAATPVDIPAGQLVDFGTNGAQATLVDLTNALLPAQIVNVTFTFASGGSTTIKVPVTTPLSAVPQAPTSTP